jgi:diacylglycerol kinase (ATP)
MTPKPPPDPVNPQKTRRGLTRIWYAAGYSIAGLKTAWAEPAFRLEVVLALVLVPLAFWVGKSWMEVSLLAGSVLAVVVVETLNTAIETTVDRVGLEHNELSKVAKDLGSAAVFLSLCACCAVWVAGLYHRLT